MTLRDWMRSKTPEEKARIYCPLGSNCKYSKSGTCQWWHKPEELGNKGMNYDAAGNVRMPNDVATQVTCAGCGGTKRQHEGDKMFCEGCGRFDPEEIHWLTFSN